MFSEGQKLTRHLYECLPDPCRRKRSVCRSSMLLGLYTQVLAQSALEQYVVLRDQR